MKRDDGSLLALGAAGLLAGAAALSRRGGAPNRHGKPTPKRTLIGSTWADQESARRHMQMLLKVMDPDDRELAQQYAAISSGWLREWLEQHGEDFDAGGAYDTQELIRFIDKGFVDEAVAELTDDGVEDFNEYASRHAAEWGEMPPAQVFTGPELLRDVWLIHHSGDPSIETEGFRFGVQGIDGLAYTGSGHTYEGQQPGYNFAYDPDDHARYGMDGDRPRYGSYVYAFWVPWAIKARHHGDQEPQVIFWGPSARNIVQIHREEVWDPNARGWGGSQGAMRDRWVIEGLDEERPGRTIATDDAGDLVDWLAANYDQYRRVLGQRLDRRRRRTERGWKRQQVGEQQYAVPWSETPRKREVYADVYKGPRKGGVNKMTVEQSLVSLIEGEGLLPLTARLGPKRVMHARMPDRTILGTFSWPKKSDVEVGDWRQVFTRTLRSLRSAKEEGGDAALSVERARIREAHPGLLIPIKPTLPEPAAIRSMYDALPMLKVVDRATLLRFMEILGPVTRISNDKARKMKTPRLREEVVMRMQISGSGSGGFYERYLQVAHQLYPDDPRFKVRKGGPNRKAERPIQVVSTRAQRVGFKASAVAKSLSRGRHHDPGAVEYVEVTLAGTPDQLRSRRALELARQVGDRELPGASQVCVASGIHQNHRGQMVRRFEVS